MQIKSIKIRIMLTVLKSNPKQKYLLQKPKKKRRNQFFTLRSSLLNVLSPTSATFYFFPFILISTIKTASIALSHSSSFLSYRFKSKLTVKMLTTTDDDDDVETIL